LFAKAEILFCFLSYLNIKSSSFKIGQDLAILE
jgi:hypothetical protein